jgi:glycosyltransferase involved in cell wall biosynthesis
MENGMTSLAESTTDREPREVHISVVVPVVERFDDLVRLYQDFSGQISQVTGSFEFLFVVDASQAGALRDLCSLQARDSRVRVYRFNACFGEAAALDAGFKKARGELVFTLASYYQVQPNSFQPVYEALMHNADVVITRRYPRMDSRFNRMQSVVFHWITAPLSGKPFHDVSCGFRGMRGEVARTLTLYGDLHRFIPALAEKQGYRVVELKATQHPQDVHTRIHGVRVYGRRLLDIFTLFFLVKFTKKPLRFFGAVGALIAVVGFFICAYLTILRLFFGQPLADRPLLLLGVMLLVGGMQTIAIGLIGEIIVFTHARDSKDYQIESVIE